MDENESWNTWRKHVLAEIKRVNGNAEKIQDGVHSLKVEIAKLQVKSGVWGLVGGMVPVVVLIAMQKFTQ